MHMYMRGANGDQCLRRTGNCNPRLPAVLLQTKKDGPNRDRYYYACQLPWQDKCNFFLWDDAARARAGDKAEAAPALPAPPPPPAPPRRRTKRQATLAEVGITPRKPGAAVAPGEGEADAAAAGSKRKRGGDGDDDDDDNAGSDYSDGFDSDMERALTALAAQIRPAAAGSKALPHPEKSPRTPSPAGGKQAERQLPTPPASRVTRRMTRLQEGESSGGADSRSPKRVRFSTPPLAQSRPAPTASAAPMAAAESPPTPSKRPRRRSSSSSQADTNSDNSSGDPSGDSSDDGYDDYEITRTILALLADHHVPGPARTAVRSALNAHALRVAGVYKGREMVRTALSRQAAQILELQARVAELESAAAELTRKSRPR